jgi:ubiquinone/menaquinone biosynthesis C-methylase UbiE
VPIVWYGCVSFAPSLPNRVQAALTPLRSAVFNYHYGQHKRALFSSLRGDVLELGAADGSNFPFLPPHLVYSAIEPNAHQLSSFADNAVSAGYPIGTIALSNGDIAQTLHSLPDDSKDAVIACFALSGQPRAEDCEALLRDVHRVLKPGGRFYLIDYTARNADDTAARALQSALSTVYRLSLVSPAVPHPIAQTLSRNDDDWETVWLQAWRRHEQPELVQPVTAEAVTGLHSLSPVIAGVCVKRKASTLSAYVAQKEGSNVMDELLKFGTFRGGKAAFDRQQQLATAGGSPGSARRFGGQ